MTTATPRPARRDLVSRGLVVACATLLAGLLLPAPSGSAQSGACPDDEGVTVVVDFRDLGGGTIVACAAQPVDSGLDALTRAGIEWDTSARFPTLVCRIEGAPASEPCQNAPPPDAYWSYWHAEAGGSWTYSRRGAADRTPPPGSVEGWSFSTDPDDQQRQPPRTAPPGRSEPEPEPEPEPDPTTASPSPSPRATATSEPAAPSPAPTTAPPASSPAAAPPPAPPASPSPSAPPSASPSEPRPATTTPGSTETPTASATTATPRPTPTPTRTMPTADPDPTPTATSTDMAAAADDDGGGGLGTVAGLLLVAGLVGAGVVVARRRR